MLISSCGDGVSWNPLFLPYLLVLKFVVSPVGLHLHFFLPWYLSKYAEARE